MKSVNINEIGNVYGNLTVTRRAEDITSPRDAIRMRTDAAWVCKCTCGGEIIIRDRIIRGKARPKTCGCRGITKEQRLANYAYGRIKNSAKQREIYWNLTKEYLSHVITLPCHYCGRQQGLKFGRDGHGNPYRPFVALDRIDSSKGYTKDNVVPCCKECNFAKHTLPVKEFKKLIIDIYRNWASK